MSTLGGISAGLAFLPNWLTETKDAVAFDALLSGWVRTSGWRSAGVVWPAETNSGVILQARPEGVDKLQHAPAELAEVMKGLRSGSATVVWQLPGSAGRLYTLLAFPGRPVGVVWAERGPQEPWGEVDRNYLRMSARLIERSPSLAAHAGPFIDPDRLHQRLADAAVIAGRMAHDFDNILTGIMGFADLTLPQLTPGTQPAKFVAEIAKVGQRGVQFTQELHQLNRSGQGKPQPASVAAILAKEETRLRPAAAPAVTITTHIPVGLNAVGMDSDPLGRVLGHVLANAIEATPAGGRVTVTALIEVAPSDARSYLGQVSAGSHVEIVVHDSGPGIKPEVRAKLFAEPFFTTKVRHRGLGLAVVFRTLSAHRGGIRIENPPTPETGTTVRVLIPPAAARSATTSPAFATPTFIGG